MEKKISQELPSSLTQISKSLSSYTLNINNLDDIRELDKWLSLCGYSFKSIYQFEANDINERDLKGKAKVLLEKPILLVNKYNDIYPISQKEVSSLEINDFIITFFEKIPILIDKEPILRLNDFDYMLLLNLSSNINY
jgi:hypothetical protein